MSSAAGDVPAPRSRGRRLGGLVAGLLVAGFLALAVIGGWHNVVDYPWRFDAGFLALAVVFIGAGQLAMAAGYTLILEDLAGRRLPRWRVLSIWTQSMLARYVPGNVMMVAGRVVLGREAGIAGRVSVAASTYEQALVLGVSAAVAAVLLVSVGDLGQGAWIWLVLVVPLGLLGLHPRVFGPVVNALLRRVRRDPLETFLSPRDVATIGALYVAVAGCQGLGVWAAVRALTGPAAGGPLVVGAGFLLSFVVSMLAFIFPSGLGVREGVFALVLARNLPGEVAIAAAAASRLVITLVEMAFAAVVLTLTRRRRPSSAGSTPTS